ncbi:hypothetical protein ACJ73_09087 [Blastomyces percursus]|uniref:Uncharacterized protein n=1 Tax=Blastomyces percursus TaxID=1658174 RepID=A0A1J9Q2G0_9EURO|nr:hypothetical protein ACJ73_09087 [Blastomyces percursus]
MGVKLNDKLMKKKQGEALKRDIPGTPLYTARPWISVQQLFLWLPARGPRRRRGRSSCLSGINWERRVEGKTGATGGDRQRKSIYCTYSVVESKCFLQVRIGGGRNETGMMKGKMEKLNKKS